MKGFHPAIAILTVQLTIGVAAIVTLGISQEQRSYVKSMISNRPEARTLIQSSHDELLRHIADLERQRPAEGRITRTLERIAYAEAVALMVLSLLVLRILAPRRHLWPPPG